LEDLFANYAFDFAKQILYPLCMINHDKYKESIVVGLSGGADSVALLYVLREAGAQIFAAHINHGLRGEESERDETFVRELCKREGVELQVFRANVQEFAATQKLGTEEAARILRYRFFEQAMTSFAANKIAVGHNADDNAETVLMNLCRGSGLSGLCGIPPVSPLMSSAEGTIIRPLLGVYRTEIEAYLRERNIDFVTDSTNASDDFTRNRVRNKILPALQSEVNPGAKAAIAKAAELLRADDDFLEITAQSALASCSPAPHTICIQKFLALHPAIMRRVVRLAITQARGNKADITQTHVFAVTDLSKGQTGREIHLPGVVVSKEYGTLVFSKEEKCTGFCYPLTPGISLTIPEIDKTFTLSSDAPAPLFLRTRKPGDKITLKTADGKFFTKKLQDYFTDEKIPRRQRDKIPLLALGSEILLILHKKNRANAKFEPGDFLVIS